MAPSTVQYPETKQGSRCTSQFSTEGVVMREPSHVANPVIGGDWKFLRIRSNRRGDARRIKLEVPGNWS